MRVLKCFFLFLLSIFVNPVWAEQQFDCGFSILPADAAIREVTLTEDVYSCLKKSDYRDLQVINGDGNPVPFIVQHPVSESEVLDFKKPLKFNVDTIDPGFDRHSQLRRLIRSRTYWNDANGFDSWNRQHSYLSVLVLDNSQASAKINRLNVDVANQSLQPLSATVVMEYSADLIRWTSSSNPQKLYFQQNIDQGFNKNQLILGAAKNRRYIRLAILSNSDHFADSIIKIEGQYQKTQKIAPDYYWARAASIQQLSNGQDWQFSVHSQLPVSQMRFLPGGDIVYYSGLLMQKPIENELKEDNAYLGLRDGKKNQLKKALKNMVTGSNRSLESMNSGWQSVKRFHQYHFNDSTISAEPVYFFPRPSRHWRIKFDHPTAEMISTHFPEVEFGWTPARIRFLVQGPEPFQLQAGSNDHIPRLASPGILRSSDNYAVSSLVASASNQDNNSDNSTSQSLSDAEKSNGGSDFMSSQRVIWLVLIFGVAVMGFMAWQLLGSIKKQAEKDQQE